jgi:ribosomal protein S18 acetylase RimI-like enzyme
MASKKAWNIRAFEPGGDDAGITKLLMQVATFDGGVAALSSSMLAARLQHPSAHSGEAWRVAVSSNGTIIGALLVFFVGTLRTEVLVAVNPAFRRQGIGRSLLDLAPREKRLLATSRSSVGGASALLTAAGFTERYGSLLMRREVGKAPSLPVEGMAFNEDPKKDARRAIVALTASLGDDVDDDRGWMKARLGRDRVGVVYLQAPGEDEVIVDAGICIVEPSDRARKGERTASGEPIVGVIADVGLMRTMRGKGMSRALVREGIRMAERLGFRFVEVAADKRRAAAVELYEREGFEIIDEEIHWLRREKRGSRF